MPGEERRSLLVEFSEAASMIDNGDDMDDCIVCSTHQTAISCSGETDQEKLAEGGLVKYIISDETLDRHGDIVRASGWQLANYKKNPVVLWAHSHDTPPVAKCTSIMKKARLGQLVAFAEYPSAELYEFGNTVYKLVVNGFLSAVSVGFMPLQWKALDEDNPYDGIEVTKQDLWEFSNCPVPANPNAFRLAANKMPGGARFIRRWAEEVLDTMKDPDGSVEVIEALKNVPAPATATKLPEEDVEYTTTTSVSAQECDVADDVENVEASVDEELFINIIEPEKADIQMSTIHNMIKEELIKTTGLLANTEV